MIINQLLRVSGNASKVKLQQEAGPADLEMFKLAYDKAITFGIKFKDHEISFTSLQTLCLADRAILTRLSNRSLTGTAARRDVTRHCEEHGDLVKLICNKDLSCGVTATTINKVFPGTINVFMVQLAKEVPLDSLTYPLYAQLKYDGVRVIVTVENSHVLFRTRNGKVLHLPKTAISILAKLGTNRMLMLDTEVTMKGGLTTDRTKVSGLLNSAQSSQRTGNYIDESVLEFNVFDAMPLEEFNNHKCSLPYEKRITMYQIECANLGEMFVPAKSEVVRSVEQADSVFRAYLEQGLEGIILKSAEHKYTFKRSKDWVKLKAVKDCDLLCTDALPGTGKYQGMIGKLVCEGNIKGKAIRVNVGTGLSDEQRAAPVWEYLGRTIEVKYNDLIQDSKTKEWSLFLPRFVTVRFDK